MLGAGVDPLVSGREECFSFVSTPSLPSDGELVLRWIWVVRRVASGSTSPRHMPLSGPASFPHALSVGAAIWEDGYGCDIRIICIHIHLKHQYEYPYLYSISIWMSYGCIWIRFSKFFSIRIHIHIRNKCGISDHIRVHKEKVTSKIILNLSL